MPLCTKPFLTLCLLSAGMRLGRRRSVGVLALGELHLFAEIAGCFVDLGYRRVVQRGFYCVYFTVFSFSSLTTAFVMELFMATSLWTLPPRFFFRWAKSLRSFGLLLGHYLSGRLVLLLIPLRFPRSIRDASTAAAACSGVRLLRLDKGSLKWRRLGLRWSGTCFLCCSFVMAYSVS